MTQAENEARRVMKNMFNRLKLINRLPKGATTVYLFAKSVVDDNAAYSVYASVFIEWHDNLESIKAHRAENWQVKS
jgi:hypothetical protein